jgi:putative tricarboxylic transport membrane protein
VKVLRHLSPGVAVASIVCAAVGIWAAYDGVAIGLWRGRSPGEGLYPFMIALGVMGLSAAYAVEAGTVPAENTGADDAEAVAWRKVAIYLAGLAGFEFLLSPLGYLLVLPAIVFLILVLAEDLPPGVAAAIALATLGTTYVIFERLLALPLPRGPF